jgi:Protein of unknown function (DUF4058)
MPMHDWTRVDAGTFHDFHLAWIAELRKALNGGVLPKGYYAQAEQFAGGRIPDVLGLHESDPLTDPPPDPTGGGVATLTKTRPKVDERFSAMPKPVKGKSRSLAIRSAKGHRIVAFIEIVSPGNKDRVESVDEITNKVMAALAGGVHVLVLDPFPPGPSDPLGLHAIIWRRWTGDRPAPYPDRPLVFAAYAAGEPVQAFVNRLAVGDDIPQMPLFLTPKKFITVPLAATYAEAYSGVPSFWRNVIENGPVD